MPSRRRPKPKDCPYQVPWFGRARWIADRYKLPFADVEHALWSVVGPGLDGCAVVIEDYMLEEKPDCNIGCSLCIRERGFALARVDESLPLPRVITPAEFVSSVKKSRDPKLSAASLHIRDVQSVHDVEPDVVAARPACSFCGRTYLHAGPMMSWNTPEKVPKPLYMCRRCAEAALVVIALKAESEREVEPKPKLGVDPKEWRKIARRARQSKKSS